MGRGERDEHCRAMAPAAGNTSCADRVVVRRVFSSQAEIERTYLERPAGVVPLFAPRERPSLADIARGLVPLGPAERDRGAKMSELAWTHRLARAFGPRLRALGLLGPGTLRIQRLPLTVVACVSPYWAAAAFRTGATRRYTSRGWRAVVLHETLHAGMHEAESSATGGVLCEATTTLLGDMILARLDPAVRPSRYDDGHLLYEAAVGLVPLYFRSLRVGATRDGIFEWLRRLQRFEPADRAALDRVLVRALPRGLRETLMREFGNDEHCGQAFHARCGHTLSDRYLRAVGYAVRYVDLKLRFRDVRAGISAVRLLMPEIEDVPMLLGLYAEVVRRGLDPAWVLGPRDTGPSVRSVIAQTARALRTLALPRSA